MAEKVRPNWTECSQLTVGGNPEKRPNECDLFLKVHHDDEEDIYDITNDQSSIYWKHLEKDEIAWLIDVLKQYLKD